MRGKKRLGEEVRRPQAPVCLLSKLSWQPPHECNMDRESRAVYGQKIKPFAVNWRRFAIDEVGGGGGVGWPS